MNGSDMTVPLPSSGPRSSRLILREAANDSLSPRGTVHHRRKMEFRILGPMEVLDGPRRARLPGGRGRALLALLILRAGEAVPVDRLIDDLWGEQPPPTVSTALQGLV